VDIRIDRARRDAPSSSLVSDVIAHRLLEAVSRLSFCRELPAVMETVRDVARALSGADGVTFVLRDGDECYYADESAIAPLWKGRRFPLESCISGWVMLHGRAAVIEDIYADPRIPADAYRPTFVQSLAMVPVRREAPVAAIGAYWARRHDPAEHEVAALQTLADAAALALENVSLYEALQRTLESERTAREQAEEASRTKDEFLAVVSHELRTPLTAILGWAKMLAGGRLDEGTTRRAVEVIARNTESQLRLISALIDVSQAMSGKIVLQVGDVDLAHVVRTVLDAMAAAIEAKGIVLNVSVPAEARLRGDAERLQQVVWNLVSNALKFTAAGGRIDVRLECVDAATALTVADSGIGIAPHVLPHVFERFRQADASVTRPYPGLGLGLAIVRHLVELHGGRVVAESAGEGRGATFRVDVPTATVARIEGVAVS
jgi:signal transduction histidine kinase